MPEETIPPYRVSPEEGHFRVTEESGRTIMICHDEASATHYAVLLSEAYRRGYKTGFRDARKH